jgi:phenylacetate-coenzyme A ligase PaaK-like adenylate-forming protein
MAWHGGSLFDVACHREIGALPYFENIAEPELGLKIAKIFDINIIYLALPNVRPLSQRMEREGTTLKASYFPRLKFASVTGELSKNTLEYHAEMLGVPVFSHWFVTEPALIGGCCSNEAQQTGAAFHQHLPEDMHFIEIFPPELDTAVDKAEFGEFVITNMFFESMAYIRFRTEDMGQVRYDPCPYCGYTHMQARVMSRVTESVNVKGKLITMAEIEDILLSYPEVRFLPEQIIREEPQPQDRLRLRLCCNAELVKEPKQFKLRMEDEFNKRLGVDAVVDLITPEEVRALVHKWERVVKEKRQG